MTARRSVSAIDRLLAKVTIDMNGCWIWTGGQDRGGYGRIRMGRRGTPTLRTHRVTYEHLVGPIPEGLQLDHLCRVRACCNPEHLEPVTCRENLMRGESFSAANAAKTHCPAGHPYDEANTYTWKNNRKCRLCHLRVHAAWRARRAEVICQISPSNRRARRPR